MLVLAPDPSLGLAPDRVTRVRRALDRAQARTVPGPRPGGPAPAVPGVVVALPGGPEGALDALVVRPDGVLGLAPAGVREPVGAPGPAPADARDCVGEAARAELERLLGLTDPPVAGPRRALAVAEDGETGALGDETRAALVAPLGPARVLGVDDLRRLLTALRLAAHLPAGDELAAAGFGPGRLPATGVLPAAEDGPSVGEDPGAASAPRRGRAGPRSLRGVPERVRERLPGRRARTHTHAGLPAWVWGWRGLALAAVAAFLASLGLAVVMGRASQEDSTRAAAPAARTVDGVTFTRRSTASDATCEGRAYGEVVGFLRRRPCAGLARALWTGTVSGRPVVVAVETVRMRDVESATALKSLIDTPGTGNVVDLLRERRSWPGAPASLTSAGYASMLLGDRLVIAEADALDPSFTDGATLDRTARDGLALR